MLSVRLINQRFPRNFSFVRKLSIKCGEVEVSLELKILQDSASELTGMIKYNSDDSTKIAFGKEFYKKINIDWEKEVRFLTRNKSECGVMRMEKDGEIKELANHSKWACGEFTIFLLK